MGFFCCCLSFFVFYLGGGRLRKGSFKQTWKKQILAENESLILKNKEKSATVLGLGKKILAQT